MNIAASLDYSKSRGRLSNCAMLCTFSVGDELICPLKLHDWHMEAARVISLRPIYIYMVSTCIVVTHVHCIFSVDEELTCAQFVYTYKPCGVNSIVTEALWCLNSVYVLYKIVCPRDKTWRWSSASHSSSSSSSSSFLSSPSLATSIRALHF